MKRVTSLGGIFFKSKDPQKVKDWYSRHLGLNMDTYGTSFEWRHSDDPGQKGFTAWSAFKDDTDYFQPSVKEFMVNYRVEDLEWLIKQLREEGVEIIKDIKVYEYGKFAHIMDPEGNKIELWEPNDAEYEKILEKTTK